MYVYVRVCECRFQILAQCLQFRRKAYVDHIDICALLVYILLTSKRKKGTVGFGGLSTKKVKMEETPLSILALLLTILPVH